MGCLVLHANNFLENETDIYIGQATVTDKTAPHAHDFIEIAYVISGTGHHRISNKEESITKGDILILNAHQIHQFVCEKDSTICIYNCIFDPTAIDSAFGDCNNFVDAVCRYLIHSSYDTDNSREYILLKNTNHSGIDRLLRELYMEFQEKKSGYRQIIQLGLTWLLILVFRLYQEDATQPQNTAMYKKLVVENALQFMRKHVNADISCKLLAKNAYLSQSYFIRVFKEVTGTTPVTALQQIRMEEACRLLTQTSLSVAQISWEVGY